jgi:hypothetical protein
MMKLALIRTTTGKEDADSDVEDKFIRVKGTSDCRPKKCFTDQVTDTSQHQLFREDCMNQAFLVELLQRNNYGLLCVD